MHADGLRLSCIFALLAASSATAAPTLRYSADQRGNFVLFGNTLARDCGVNSPLVVGTVGACGSNASDTGADVLWRSDEPSIGQALANTSVTVENARSTAVLQLPAGAVVTYARLYWAAVVPTAKADTSVVIERPGSFVAAVEADDSRTQAHDEHRYYQSTADITSLLQSHGTGAYRLSGVEVMNPENERNEVLFAAWSVVVFYQLDTEPPRNLALFDGLDLVRNGSTASGTVSGFLVPNAGFDGRLGVIAYEGDSSISGDSLSFNGSTLSDGVNPNNNFFNSSRGNLGSAVSMAGDLPRSNGASGSMTGVDLDVVSVTSRLKAKDTSASFSATTSSDTYLIGAFVTSVSTLKPVRGISIVSGAGRPSPLARRGHRHDELQGGRLRRRGPQPRWDRGSGRDRSAQPGHRW